MGILTLHPQSIARSYYPQALLNAFSLRQVGSRPSTITPEQWTRDGEPSELPTTELMVAGDRSQFRNWERAMVSGGIGVPDPIRRIEGVRAPRLQDKIRGQLSIFEDFGRETLLEVVLHLSKADECAVQSSGGNRESILSVFADYAEACEARAILDRCLYAGGLCFLPVEIQTSRIRDLTQFSFLRVARPMPRLRSVAPIERATTAPDSDPCPLPGKDPVNPELKVVVFDGGLEMGTGLDRWVTSHDPNDIGTADEAFLSHGHDVTSALLFGTLDPGEEAPQPYAFVDHYRVLDDKCSSDPYELYDTLCRIQTVLEEKMPEFVNLSIGPALPVDDDEVHSWTALLDQYLADGDCLCAIAAGNNGGVEGPASERKIQVPSDCVNGLTVGAADTTRAGWRRAPYSAVGPGRAPGATKPDVLTFGGTGREPFIVFASDGSPFLAHTQGTSFAAPSALRLALGVRAHFGERLSPLALKALLINSAEQGTWDRAEVGWGRLPCSIDDLVVCEKGAIRVVYQGDLDPGRYMRALIPVPDDPISGNVSIAATFCFATPVDPEDPGSYTRSGLEVTFRPHAHKFAKPSAVDPASAQFFKRSEFDTEGSLRKDAQKWETVLHAVQSKRGSSLYRPVFDVHYTARSGGAAPVDAGALKYALVVTVNAPRSENIYDQVLRQYAGVLEALRPVVEIPVKL